MKTRKIEKQGLNRWLWAGLLVGGTVLGGCTQDTTKEGDANSIKRFQLSAATSCEDIEDTMVDALVERALTDRYEYYRGGIDVDFGAEQNNASEPPSSGNDDQAGDSPDDYTTTNVQEVGVDEADFVKTDGNHIYTINNGELIIVKSWPADQSEVVGRVSLSDGYPTSMFLHGDRIALFSSIYSYRCSDVTSANNPTNNVVDGDVAEPGFPGECTSTDNFNGTRITLLDITDRTAPSIISQSDIGGEFNNARMIDDDVYVVSNSSVQMDGYWDIIWDENLGLPELDWDATEDEIEDAKNIARPILQAEIEAMIANNGALSILPKQRSVAADGTASAATDLYKCTDVYLPAIATELGVLNVSHFEIDAPNPSITSTGLLAGGWTVYSSQENLYVALSSRSWWGWNEGNYSHIHKFSLDGPNGKALYAASGEVDGWLLNQFSMSEHEAHLRLAVTDNRQEEDENGNWVWAGGNHVIILKDDQGELVETGAIRGLAPDERVYSARFMGDKGYVVTFRETDPLYTFDLSDPTNPQLLGELKINGFSSYIHPMGENHLLTIGQDADSNGQVLGVHLQIFDVTDMANPTRTHQHLLSTGPWSSWSEAMWDHHAFTYHAGKEILAVPLNSWENNADPFSGLVVLRASSSTGFTELGRVDHAPLTGCQGCDPNEYHWWVDVRRSIFMDDYLYSISSLGIMVNGLEDPSVEVDAVQF
ncbi:beta-propeller domain-containing protein [Microvenator marinus]|nr:beta-propeller domain-containing protein [Microvenator marinus]